MTTQKFLRASLPLLLAATSLPAQAAPAPLKGAGPWSVMTTEKFCALVRNFDGRGGPMTMAIKSPLIGEDYSVTVTRNSRRLADVSRGQVRLSNAQGIKSRKMPLESFTPIVGQRVSKFTIEESAFKLRESGSVLTIDMGLEGERTLTVVGFPKALDKLDECMRAVRKGLGVDQAELDSIRTPIRNADITGLFKPSDYPKASLRARQRGVVGVLFYVETDGRVKDCRVVEKSGHPDLDDTTCNIIRARTRATAALDAAGKSIRAPSYAQVRWSFDTFDESPRGLLSNNN